MHIEYKVFYVENNNYEPLLDTFTKLDLLITSKMNEGWKLVGGVTSLVQDTVICQAMTLETINEDLLK